jgi:hypothetical protein
MSALTRVVTHNFWLKLLSLALAVALYWMVRR